MAVREPLSRFGSLWRDKCYDRPPRVIDYVKGMSPDQLMDHIEDFPFGNGHWVPQWYYTLPGIKLVKYDKLQEFLGLPQTHANQSKKTEIDLPEERILSHYRKDLEMWKSL